MHRTQTLFIIEGKKVTTNNNSVFLHCYSGILLVTFNVKETCFIIWGGVDNGVPLVLGTASLLLLGEGVVFHYRRMIEVFTVLMIESREFLRD